MSSNEDDLGCSPLAPLLRPSRHVLERVWLRLVLFCGNRPLIPRSGATPLSPRRHPEQATMKRRPRSASPVGRPCAALGWTATLPLTSTERRQPCGLHICFTATTEPETGCPSGSSASGACRSTTSCGELAIYQSCYRTKLICHNSADMTPLEKAEGEEPGVISWLSHPGGRRFESG